MTRAPDRPVPAAGERQRRRRVPNDSAFSDEMQPESGAREGGALDRDGRARPERPVNSGRSEGTADQAGIEIDHAAERPPH